jgi:hypothetical protein
VRKSCASFLTSRSPLSWQHRIIRSFFMTGKPPI